jgi:hypothetical protein
MVERTVDSLYTQPEVGHSTDSFGSSRMLSMDFYQRKVILPDQNIDRVRCYSSSVPMNGRGLCTCKCSDVRVSESVKQGFIV